MYRLVCATSGQAFLVDTGVAVSLLPRGFSSGPVQENVGDNPVLQTANGDFLPSFGSQKLQMNFDSKLHFHTFVIADVVEPMLGWDFLSQHLAVIIARDPRTYFQCVCEAASLSSANANFVRYRRPVRQRTVTARQSNSVGK